MDKTQLMSFTIILTEHFSECNVLKYGEQRHHEDGGPEGGRHLSEAVRVVAHRGGERRRRYLWQARLHLPWELHKLTFLLNALHISKENIELYNYGLIILNVQRTLKLVYGSLQTFV